MTSGWWWLDCESPDRDSWWLTGELRGDTTIAKDQHVFHSEPLFKLFDGR